MPPPPPPEPAVTPSPIKTAAGAAQPNNRATSTRPSPAAAAGKTGALSVTVSPVAKQTAASLATHLDTHGWTVADWVASARSSAQGDHLARLLALARVIHAEFASPNDPQLGTPWLAAISEADIIAQFGALTSRSHFAGTDGDFPLYGVPVAVKDNIDFAGYPTTAACPGFKYVPTRHATVVDKLIAAGAIVVGKTNLDQFATGLVGTRSPMGAVRNAFAPERISGGSSSGSASVVARGLVPISLGTDTAGSGRVPAGFNNLVGLKPTKGRLSARGVVPACKSLDTVSVFALGIKDAQVALRVMQGQDDQDEYSRAIPSTLLNPMLDRPLTILVPKDPLFVSPPSTPKAAELARGAWLRACRDAQAFLGAKVVEIDMTPMEQLAKLLYEGPWVAERWAAIGEYVEKVGKDLDPTVLKIVRNASKFSATQAFQFEYKAQALRRAIHALVPPGAILMVPTTPMPAPTLEDIANDPVGVNALLGTYTNWVNLADYCGITVPAGFVHGHDRASQDPLAFSVTLLGNAWEDERVVQVASEWLTCSQATRTLGATALPAPPTLDLALTHSNTTDSPLGCPPTHLPLAVVGAHLLGMPLHHQLTTLDAYPLSLAARTSPNYRLYALPNSTPPKPALARITSGPGSSIAVEVYAIPLGNVGKLLAQVPAPLALGTIELESGTWVKGFVCEPRAVEGALDVTRFGGWRAYMSSLGVRVPLLGGKPVLIANRGEIALRALRTLDRLGVPSVVVYTDDDKYTPHVAKATHAAVRLPSTAGKSGYMNAEAVIRAAHLTGARAVWPGYGFLSESPEFARAVEAAGLVWIGPTPEQMHVFAHKHSARDQAHRAGVAMVPASNGLLGSAAEAQREVARIGTPVMVKCTAGGGGIGLAKCDKIEDVPKVYESVKRAGEMYFGNGGVFVEKCVEKARHVEVQVVGDGRGNICILGERDCSLQRRAQKVVEEAPAPELTLEVRKQVGEMSRRLMASVNYRGVGTVECLYDVEARSCYFMEVNTRLQVEHPVTEEITNLDLIEWMLLVASDHDMSAHFAKAEADLASKHAANTVGSSIEVRVYAEDPFNSFRPCTGKITRVTWPTPAEVPGVRIETWISAGTHVTPNFDPMVAKVIVKGKNRAEALDKMANALALTRIDGITTNVEYLRQVVKSDMFSTCAFTTKSLDGFVPAPPRVLEVLHAGTGTSVQDYPGRTGYWDVGVPPSGAMDALAFRLANAIVGNTDAAPGLECTLKGPTIRFAADTVVAVTGAPVPSATITDAEGKVVDKVKMWVPVHIKRGNTLSVGMPSSGCRTYVAVRGGIKVPQVLGSCATFALGETGGHLGRNLKAGDQVKIGEVDKTNEWIVGEPKALDSSLIPTYDAPVKDGGWRIGALLGPHAAPDYLTQPGLKSFLDATWSVSHNANRLGIRLVGPKPEFARASGGQAGLHPSNLHDCPYAIGSVNLTGDTPTILTQDGPSLGGFVCPITIVQAELWKVGQLRPGDKVKFEVIEWDEAVKRQEEHEVWIKTLAPATKTATGAGGQHVAKSTSSAAVLVQQAPVAPHQPAIVYRQAGDRAVLIEYGGEENALDLTLRFRVHAVMQALTHRQLGVTRDGPITELVPGVRSLQIQYNPARMSQADLVRTLLDIESNITTAASTRTDHWQVPSRVVHLPIAFDDESARGSVDRYMQTVRQKAPWLPDNIEFLRRINGLGSRDDVRKIIAEQATYLVLGLGDVYYGSPCALPLDPRHRIVSSKYNPARTFTAEGVVGIGGVYMCAYGIDSPGGYQLVGRTLPMWNHVQAASFHPPQVQQETESASVTTRMGPWLLTFFDQVKFHLVPSEELDRLRADFRAGRWAPKIENAVFDLAEYQQWLTANKPDIDAVESARATAFSAEVALWATAEAEQAAAEQQAQLHHPHDPPASPTSAYPAHCARIVAGFAARTWKVLVKEGDVVEQDQVLVIVEAMKAELPVVSPRRGVVRGVMCAVGELVEPSDVVVVIE
ncbi:hypothetical protein BCR44DRAFT_48730 [Catenaria anguillulae PL171]|uniref:Urea amidolyase n=1 Tax=Catenaria anguillulae PL171 TaxID=765915 RepID=A0A1Y2HMP0_9FUNG|nr:hypothetical protein BCR44DRAFT_48730 [Catenaria anguillulae PL171]